MGVVMCAIQTPIEDAELDILVDEATDHIPGATHVDYHAFVTKMMST